jgi:hypothetical protein
MQGVNVDLRYLFIHWFIYMLVGINSVQVLFRSLELLLCTLSYVLLVETRRKLQALVLNLLLELLHALA